MVRIFGKTLSETSKALGGENSSHWGTKREQGKSSEDKVKAIGRIVVSVIILGVAVFLVKNDGESMLAGTLFGSVTGYWLS